MQLVGARTPMATARATTQWSPSWAVERSDGPTAVLAAGADRRVEIDGLAPATVAALRAWSAGAVVTPADDDQRLLVDRLVDLGAIQAATASATRVAVHWAGPPDDELVVALEGTGLTIAGTEDGVTTHVMIRTADVAATRLPVEHLGVDLTLHHTVLLGPFVVPGVTACLGCLRQRAAHRWGDPVVAERPAIRRWPAVVAQLVAVQVELAAAGRSPLVNATIAWDLEQGTTDRQMLYKLTGCPSCDAVRPSGRIELPT